jgi:hypothetical protein
MYHRAIPFNARGIVFIMPVSLMVPGIVPVVVIEIAGMVPWIVPVHIYMEPDSMMRTICPG